MLHIGERVGGTWWADVAPSPELKSGSVVGIVVLAIVVVAIIAVGIWFWRRRRKGPPTGPTS